MKKNDQNKSLIYQSGDTYIEVPADSKAGIEIIKTEQRQKWRHKYLAFGSKTIAGTGLFIKLFGVFRRGYSMVKELFS